MIGPDWGMARVVVVNDHRDGAPEDPWRESAQNAHPARAALRLHDLEAGVIGVRQDRDGPLRGTARQVREHLPIRVPGCLDARAGKGALDRTECVVLVVGDGRLGGDRAENGDGVLGVGQSHCCA